MAEANGESSELRTLSKTGIIFRCADKEFRRCFPVLACCSADYPEQCTITGIKQNYHCSKCLVAPNKRNDLCVKEEPRSEDQASDRIRLQKQLREKNTTIASWDATMNIHENPIFTLGHDFTDIHQAIAMDILHIFFSNGLVSFVLSNVLQILRSQHPESTLRDDMLHGKKSNKKRTKKKAEFNQDVNSRMRISPRFPTTQVLSQGFLESQQKTGNEWKAVSKILVPALAPLLTPVNKVAMFFIRAFADFITLVQQRAHDEVTLGYMTKYLEIMDVCKHSLVSADPKGISRLNRPKWHQMTHLAESIRAFGSLDGTDSSYGEYSHSSWVKDLSRLTNFRPQSFHYQLTNAMSRLFLIRVRKDHEDYEKRQDSHRKQQENEIEARTVNVGRAQSNIQGLGRPSEVAREWSDRKVAGIASKYRAKEIAEWACLPNLPHLLAVFVQLCRENENWTTVLGETKNTDWESDNGHQEAPRWANDLIVSIHRKLKLWVQDENTADQDILMQQSAYCAWDWQNQKDHWRRDFVFAQEYEDSGQERPSATIDSGLNGRIPVELNLIFTVYDMDAPGYSKAAGAINEAQRRKPPQYTGVLVRQFRVAKDHDPIHGLMEFRPGSSRIYSIRSLGPSIHMFPTGSTDEGRYFNPYVNNTSFNDIWDPVYFDQGLSMAQKLVRRSKFQVPRQFSSGRGVKSTSEDRAENRKKRTRQEKGKVRGRKRKLLDV